MISELRPSFVTHDNGKRMDKIILEHEGDDEILLTRKVMGNGFSLCLSFIVHLSIFLILAFIFRSTFGNGTITLELDPNSFSDLSNSNIAIVEFDDSAEALALSEEIEPELDETESLDVADVFDFAELEEFPDAFSGNLPYSENTVATENGGDAKSRKASSSGFFGIEATGDRIVYIIDMSPSMQVGYPDRRFDRAVNEVLASIDQLKPEQEFFVILFCFKKYMMPTRRRTFMPANERNKKSLEAWLGARRLESGTDPREAIVAALQMRPTCCFLLSDGEFNGRFYGTGKYRHGASAVELARKHNEWNCPIHTIGLEDEGSQADMNQIAKDSGGIYKFVPAISRDQ